MFTGQYINEYRRLMLAAALSGQNLFALSRPGYGKTEAALEYVGCMQEDEAQTVFIELSPDTPISAILGTYDPAAMLAGRLERRIEGTPYDPRARVVILDEIGRASEPVGDALIHATSQKRRALADRPVFIATSNFTIDSARTEALNDRFGLWLVINTDIDPAAVISANLSATNRAYTLPDAPTWTAITENRRRAPGPKAVRMIADLLTVLSEEATKEGFNVNPRRLIQWSQIAYFVTAFHKQTDDFSDLHPDATAALAYAYPVIERNQTAAAKITSLTQTAGKWQKVTSAIADVIGSAIESYRAEAVSKFIEVMRMTSASDRTAAIATLGQTIATAQTDLQRIAGNDPRAAKVLDELTDYFRRAVSGETIEA